MDRFYRLNVTNTLPAEDCSRKAIVYILSIANDIEIPFKESEASISGKILHSLLQNVITWAFDSVRYYYNRENCSILDSIQFALEDNYKLWEALINKDDVSYPWGKLNDINFGQKVLDRIDENLHKLAYLSSSVIEFNENENQLISNVISSEFRVELPLQNALLVGKIDLIAWGSENELRVIELKTGTPTSDDINQVNFYAEVIKENFPFLKVVPERWRTKSLKNGKIDRYDPIEKNSRILREKAQELINKALKIDSETKLPRTTKNNYYCIKFCKLCDIVLPQLSFPSHKKKQKQISDFFQ